MLADDCPKIKLDPACEDRMLLVGEAIVVLSEAVVVSPLTVKSVVRDSEGKVAVIVCGDRSVMRMNGVDDPVQGLADRDVDLTVFSYRCLLLLRNEEDVPRDCDREVVSGACGARLVLNVDVCSICNREAKTVPEDTYEFVIIVESVLTTSKRSESPTVVEAVAAAGDSHVETLRGLDMLIPGGSVVVELMSDCDETLASAKSS